MSASQGNVFTRGLSRISRRKKKTKSIQNSLVSEQQPSFDAAIVPMPIPNDKSSIFSKGMDRLRRSLRLPKKRRDRSHDRHLSPDVTGGSKTEQWQPDEGAVRTGTCCFNVKYLGSVEVYESRGMQVCEGALKSLKASRRKPVKAVLYVSGDGLRVVDQGNSRGLLVDQTIEKVSFCAPDRQTDKGFAYICRDGASRRWMCHGFLATKETGERLSHAVGCAFSICLEKKKRRDEETAQVNVQSAQESTSSTPPKDIFHPNWEDNTSEGTSTQNPSNSRSNLAYQSFRKHVSIEDRYLDPQSVIINEVPASNHMDEIRRISKPRPTGNPALFLRQGSLRAPPDMPSSSDQFKRNMSLRTVSNNPTERSPEKKSFGTQLYNEPIYEGDEDPLGLGITPPVVTKTSGSLSNNGLDGINLNWKSIPAPVHQMQQHNANGDFVAAWPQNTIEKPTVGPLDKLQKQFEDIKLISISSGENTPTTRSKADEWLDDVLRVSMSMSPTSPSSDPPSTSSYSVLPKSGPPPAHAPPPLPVRQAVSNGSPSIYQQQLQQANSTRNSPAGINWNSSPNPMKISQPPAKPVDPFDVQWSRLAVNNTH
ncbi:Numb-related protein 1 [Caenorhabditis elegans]|uniref:Numb-related protein 1 n=4 Tax=Caenorhabditis elegans TaxID=6239 RepID=NUMB1_CAEEL|nr:Numb-related protein 1 [Caenorhabditis elegans]Q9XTY6.1 RecName: Full=Numb-related protein 1; AltName: Full=CKA1; AltName: Full=Protein kinase C adapter 1 [Caenorhabditis elegans]AAK28740.1 C kinase adapter 1 [Caenorhabditis elegans]CAB07405.1 Numb-related protein 1 [Caenorhabditis elegans]|eukprot:NP_508021.1 Numb-related protein 1 [Caenorhabditis elegans]